MEEGWCACWEKFKIVVVRCIMIITEKWNLDPELYFLQENSSRILRAHMAMVMCTIWHHLYISLLCYFKWWYMFGESSINTSLPPWGLNDLSILKKLLNPFFLPGVPEIQWPAHRSFLTCMWILLMFPWFLWLCCCCLGVFDLFLRFLGRVLIHICFNFS